MRELPAAVPRDKVKKQISLVVVPPADTRTALSIPVWRRPGALCCYLLSLRCSRIAGSVGQTSLTVGQFVGGELNPDWPLVSDFSTANLLFSLSTLSRSLSLSGLSLPALALPLVSWQRPRWSHGRLLHRSSRVWSRRGRCQGGRGTSAGSEQGAGWMMGGWMDGR